MTKHPEIFAALAAPFEPGQVKTRSENNRTLYYITARTVENRLDDVIGPESWDADVAPCGDGSGAYRCVLTIRLPDGTATVRTGIGGGSDRQGRPVAPKAAASDALKRAAEGFGVARYLYRDGVPTYAGKPDAGCDPPEQEHRGGRQGQAPPPRRKPRHDWPGAGRSGVPAESDAPRTGKALFGRLKDWEREHGEGLIKYLNGWARLQEFPSRMVDWDAGQVAEAYVEARRKLAEYQRSDQVQEALAP